MHALLRFIPHLLRPSFHPYTTSITVLAQRLLKFNAHRGIALTLPNTAFTQCLQKCQLCFNAMSTKMQLLYALPNMPLGTVSMALCQQNMPNGFAQYG